MRALSTLFAAISCLAASATSQVVISEVYFTPQVSNDDEWIELRNLGTATADISTWSLYLATDTPVLAGSYWFGFPANTRIAPQSSLRVHWMAPYQPKNLAEVWTGNTVFHFLFGYGAEELGTVANAAVGLFNTQSNALMNNWSIVVDWVTWGDGWSSTERPIRENLAIQNGRWTSGTAVATPRPGDSIALIYTAQAEPTPVSAFFHDASATPVLSGNPLSGHNHENAAGNVDFGLRLSNLVPGQLGLLIIGSAKLETPWPFVPSCSFHVDLTGALLAPFTVTSPTFDQPISLEGAPPAATAYLQVVSFDTLTAIGFSPGQKIVIGK